MGYDTDLQSTGLEWLTTEDAPQLRSEGERQYIEGYAVLFYDAANPGTEYDMGGNCVERVASNAFDELLLRGDNVQAWVDHSKDWQLGETKDASMILRKDHRGIHYSIPVDPTFVDHVKAVQYAKRSKFQGSSFQARWETNVSREGNKNIKTISKVTNLLECGPCYRPRYKGTSAQLSLRSEVDAYEALRKSQEKINKWKSK